MLLSIAIPSHNKTYFLIEAVDSIIREKEFGNEIDLVISDNSLNDETKKIYEKKYFKNKNVQWFNSKKYKCLDSNVNRAVELADGEYVWIFGDDDIIEKNILKKVIDFIKKETPAILILNSSSFSESGIIENSRMPINSPKIYHENQNDKFLKEIGGYLTYIGAIIVKKDLWIKHYDKSKIGKFFAHLQCIANIKIGRRAYFLPNTAINMRVGSQTWTSEHFLIWYKYYPEIIWGLENYSNDAKNSVIQQNPILSITTLAASRAYKRFNFGIWKNMIFRSNSITKKYKFISLLISVFPTFILKNIYIAFIKYFRNKHTLNFSPKLAIARLKM